MQFVVTGTLVCHRCHYQVVNLTSPFGQGNEGKEGCKQIGVAVEQGYYWKLPSQILITSQAIVGERSEV